MNAAYRVGQLGPGDRLGHVAAGAGADHGDHVLGGVRDGEREELDARAVGRDGVDDRVAASVGQVDVEEDDLGVELLDQRHGVRHRSGLADDLDGVTELGAHAGEEEAVVVDEDDATLHRGSLSSTSVPPPGGLVTVALPPARSRRPSIDSRMPSRSSGTAPRSKPTPRSRRKTAISSALTSA